MSEKIQSESSPHRYFTMMLNMAEEDLDPYEYRLLAHYVRWSSNGDIREGIRTTATKCKMSVTKVRAARESLVKSGYLKVIPPAKKGQTTTIIVIDRWAENVLRFTRPKPADDSKCAKSDTASVSNITHIEEPIEEQVTPNGVSANTSTDEKPKSKRSEKQLANDALVKALVEACEVEASNGEYGNYLRIAQKLTKDIPSAEFPDFVTFVKKLAEKDKWTFTVNSLVSGKILPMSLYLTSKKKTPTAQQEVIEDDIEWVLPSEQPIIQYDTGRGA
jgi:hypothetical protein